MVQSFSFEMEQREAVYEPVCQLLDNEFVTVASRGLVVTVTIKQGDRKPIVVDLESLAGNNKVELRVESHILTLRVLCQPRRGVNVVWI